jgi:hypothetical protein
VDGQLSLMAQENVTAVAGAGSTGNALIATGSQGYFRVSVRDNTATSAPTFSAYITGSSAVWCHRALPSFSENLGSAQGVLISGASCLFSNTAPENAAQGEAWYVQMPKLSKWYSIVDESGGGPGKITTVPGYKKLLAKTGAYGWLRPDSPSSMEMKNSFTVSNGRIVTTAYNIVPEEDFLLLYLRIPNPGTGASSLNNPQSGTYKISYAFEYSTTNRWLSTGFAEHILNLDERVLTALTKIDQFHENPFHLSDIFNGIRDFISKGASAIVKYAPAVTKVAQAVGSVLA